MIFGQFDRPTEVWRRKARVLGTFTVKSQVWKWEVEEPLFELNAYSWEYYHSGWESSMELGVATTAKLGGNWLFVSEVDGGEMALFAAVWED